MYRLNFRERIKKNLFEYEDMDFSDMVMLLLILIVPTLILLMFNLTSMIPLVLLTETLVYFLVNQNMPIELLIKFIFLIMITFSFCIFSATFSLFNPILLLIFAIFWFGIYTVAMFFGRFTKIFGLFGILYFLIVSLNLTTLDVNAFQTWLISILSTIFSGFVVVFVNYLKNDPSICIAVSNCFKLDSSLGEIICTEELASEFSNKKLINLIEISKDIKISRLNIDKIKSNLDLDVLIVFEDILQEVDKLVYKIDHNLSKNNYNFNISLKKFESKMKFLYRFKEQDTDISEVVTKSEELFLIFQRLDNILNNEFDERYNLPKLTSNIYVVDIIKANLNTNNIYIQNFIRFILASMLSILVLFLSGTYNYYNVLLSITLVFLIIKPNTSDNSLIFSNMLSMLFAIFISLALSLCGLSGSLILIIILLCLTLSFKNNTLIKDFIFITIFFLIQSYTFTITDAVNYVNIWLIVSLSSFFIKLIIFPQTSKINLYESLSFKLKTNFNFIFEALLSKNLNEYSNYWNQTSQKNNEFEFSLNSLINEYSVSNELISNYKNVSEVIDSLTIKALAFNTHVDYNCKHLEKNLNLIKSFMDEIICNLDKNSKITKYAMFRKTYCKINKFKKNCDDKDFILALDYLLWIVYDLYILSFFLDSLYLNDEFSPDIFIY